MFELRSLKKLLHRWGGATTALFTYTHFSHDMSTSLLVPLLPFIKASLGLSYLQSGLLISAYTITSGFSQVLMGWLGDRTSRRLVLAVGLAGISLATLAVGLSPAYYPMLFIFVIMGIFAGAYHPSSNSMLAGYFEPERRGSVLGLHILGGTMGLALSPVLGGLIADNLGWRFAFIILCIPALIAVLLVLKKFRLLERINSDEQLSQVSISNGTQAKAIPRLSSLSNILRPIAIICALAVLTQFVAGCAESFIPLYLVDKHAISTAYAAMWLSVIRGGGMAGSLLGGWLSDKWGRENVVFLAIIATGPALYLLTMLPFNAALIVIFILFGVLMQMRQPALQTLLLDTTPPQLRATVIGLYFFLGMEGRSLVQPIAGYFMDIWGIVQVFNVIALITIMLSVVTLFWAIRLKLRQ